MIVLFSILKQLAAAVFMAKLTSYLLRGGFRVQNKVVTNFYKIDTSYIIIIALIFVFIVVVIIIIVNVAILFCFEILVVTAWYMPMLVASEIPWSKI